MVVNRKLGIWIASVLLLTLAGVEAQPAQAASSCRIDIGSRAPQLAGPDLMGNFHSLDDYRGKWVYVDFWASWCAPCVKDLPDVIALDQEFSGSEEVAVLSVSLDDSSTLGDLEKVHQEYRINYPVVFDGSGWSSSNRSSWCVDSIPATFLIDPEGNVVYSDIKADQASRFLQRQRQVRNQQLASGTQTMSSGVVNTAGAAPTTGLYSPRKRIQVRTGENLINSSPSTGKQDYRDFEVLVDILEDSPNVNRYQLFISTLIQKADGSYDNIDLRYDFDITFNPTDIKRPYDVSISDRSAGEGFNTDSGSLVPGVQVMVDPYQRNYRFIVPLPERILDIHYVLGLYDENLGEYIRNQPTVVDLSAFGLQY